MSLGKVKELGRERFFLKTHEKANETLLCFLNGIFYRKSAFFAVQMIVAGDGKENERFLYIMEKSALVKQISPI